METKKTSKREYAFVIHAAANWLGSLAEKIKEIFLPLKVEIIDKDKNVLRTFRLNALPEEILGILAVHGLKQKLTDDTMVSKIGEDADRLLALDDLWAQLKSGEWEKERVGVARPPEAAIVFVMEKKAIDRQTAEASLKSAGKDFWDKLRTNYKEDFARIDKKIADSKKNATAIDLTTM